MPDRSGPVFLTSPPPTPNGPLHLGHLSGPYLAADVAARAARAAGEPVVTVCGLDVHQNYVLARARTDGVPVEETLDGYGALIRSAFARARIGYDVFLDPTADADYRRVVAGLLAELVARKAALVRTVALSACGDCGATLHHAYVTGACGRCGEAAGGGTCEACGGFTTAADLRDPVCGRCGGPPRPRPATVPVLRLEEYREDLIAGWTRADLGPRARALVASYLDAGLPDVVLAHPTDWGIEADGPGYEGLRVDVWAEMALGYLYAVARTIDPDAETLDACAAAWAGVGGLWHFLGVDNAFYYAVLIPAVLAAAGVPPGVLRGLVVNEFYRLDGEKFSTSRGHAVWAHEILATEDPALVRRYLCWDRPDRYGSDYTARGLAAFARLGAGDGAAPAADGPAGEGDVLAAADVERAARALRLPSFDPALAVRCLLPAERAGVPRARDLLALIDGGPPPARSR